jgi:hypothetical protein
MSPEQAGRLCSAHRPAPTCSGPATNDRALSRGYFVPRLQQQANFEEEMMQTNDPKAAFTEKLSLGTLIAILLVTNVLVFVTLTPYA